MKNPKGFRYQLRERNADGTLWKQDLAQVEKDFAEGGPSPYYPEAWQRDSEANGAVRCGMSGVAKGCARWAVDPDDNDKLIIGCINTTQSKLMGNFNAAKVKDYLAVGYLEKDPFK